jgi:hypothetical protein
MTEVEEKKLLDRDVQKLFDLLNHNMYKLDKFFRYKNIDVDIGSVIAEETVIRYKARLNDGKMVQEFKDRKYDIADLLNCEFLSVQIKHIEKKEWEIVTPHVYITLRLDMAVFVVQDRGVDDPFCTYADDFILHAFKENMLDCFFVNSFSFDDFNDLERQADKTGLSREDLIEIHNRLSNIDEEFIVFAVNTSNADEIFMNVINEWANNSPYDNCVVFKLGTQTA